MGTAALEDRLDRLYRGGCAVPTYLLIPSSQRASHDLSRLGYQLLQAQTVLRVCEGLPRYILQDLQGAGEVATDL
jgi:hypothetical protein